jgi:hypothetical protein
MSKIITETERRAITSQNMKNKMKCLWLCHFIESHKDSEGSSHEEDHDDESVESEDEEEGDCQYPNQDEHDEEYRGEIEVKSKRRCP